MQIRLTMAVATASALLAVNASAQTREDCSEALVIATYNKTDISSSDWRLATYVSESEYDQIKHDAGANAVIYGVPVGVSYSDFQSRVREKTQTYNESLTQNQATNIMWTGLDPSASNVYLACLKAKVFKNRGMHLAVKTATKSQVSVLISWTPTGEGSVKPEWIWSGAGSLPKTVPPGERTAMLPRPSSQQILTVNYKGYTDSIIIEPFPPAPTPATFHIEETSQEYRSPEQVGWGSNWSKPYALCTDEKPEGWTIASVSDFHLESRTERNSCGAWTTCGGAETDTPRRVCRITTVQGHNENRFDGYGRLVSVFHVTWRHPVKN